MVMMRIWMMMTMTMIMMMMSMVWGWFTTVLLCDTGARPHPRPVPHLPPHHLLLVCHRHHHHDNRNQHHSFFKGLLHTSIHLRAKSMKGNDFQELSPLLWWLQCGLFFLSMKIIQQLTILMSRDNVATLGKPSTEKNNKILWNYFINEEGSPFYEIIS